VLKELGFSAGEIENFQSSGAIPHVRHLEASPTGGAE
jgi:hypothetical protein